MVMEERAGAHAEPAARRGRTHLSHADLTEGRRPLEVAGSWARAVSHGHHAEALAPCARDVRVHLPGHDLVGKRQLEGWLVAHPAYGCRRQVAVAMAERDVEVRWPAPAPAGALPGVRCRVTYGRLAELWPLSVVRPSVAPGAAPGTGLRIETVVGPRVEEDDARYAEERVGHAAERVAEAVRRARLKLSVAGDTGRARPARAEALLDLGGDAVRAAVAAGTIREAADLLVARLQDQLRHRDERRAARRRTGQPAAPGEWRHGAQPAARPERAVRPVEERRLVRMKSVSAEARSAEEAVLDMAQLDYDFYLFRDAATGADSLVERDEDGRIQLTRVGSAPTAGPVGAAPGRLAARRTLDEALELLHSTGVAFVFFEDAVTGRGTVCYARYDGDDGLVSLE